ncbi:hypothetical protein GCM10009115_33960 [Sphingopyxis soli]|uniref:Uncharacterized protein n=1 Tax=Sphingopyxis soli TaxID=592051 RepID=A0ABN1MCF3_9SPHN
MAAADAPSFHTASVGLSERRWHIANGKGVPARDVRERSLSIFLRASERVAMHRWWSDYLDELRARMPEAGARAA